MSPAKLEANRQNATLSTGPTTPQGKTASARNATTHGLTARQSILVGENPEEYHAFVNDYLDYYRPTNNVDCALVLELGDLRWRLRRVPVVETQAWNHEMLELAKLPENAKYSSNEIMAMAFVRLIQNKVITNLYAQEGRLQGRANRIQKRLEAVEHLRAMTPKPCPIPQHILERTEALPSKDCPAESAQPQSAETLPEICKNEPIRVAPKPGRNEPCPCGSGVKYKRCCLNRPQTSEKALSAAA